MKLINLNLCVGTLILVIEKTSGVSPVMMISSSGFLQLTVIGGRDTGVYLYPNLHQAVIIK